MNVITSGPNTIMPVLVMGRSTGSESRTIAHDIIGNPSGYLTIIDGAPRTGTLTLFFADEAEAIAAFTAHREGLVWQFTDGEHPELSMTYVVEGGRVELTLDEQTLEHWTVEIPFREVLA